MFNFNNITEYQLEITTYCNAACPQCPRNVQGSGINPYMPLVHLDREVIDAAFSVDHCKNIRQVFFCGSYGDPIMHPDFLDILQDFRDKSPTVWLYLHTNGGARDVSWWSELAKIIGPYGKIDFGIDGLEETNHLYRRNVKFSKVIENAKAFIDGGGKAQWNYIVFRHNEHQVDDARQLSEQMGFMHFLPRKTGRFFNHNRVSEMSRWPVRGKTGNIEYYLEPPLNAEYRNNSMLNLDQIKNDPDYFDNTEIKCDALLGKKVAINAEGLVLPCNFFNHNLYDMRFYNRETLPGSNDKSFINGKNQIAEIISGYGKDNLNINYKSLREIFDSPFWNHVISSWDKKLKDGRIFECAMTCGKKLTKVWDQGGSIR
jgi:MoaA/NifB/PqqE/SkfB family radical SAM enzyme